MSSTQPPSGPPLGPPPSGPPPEVLEQGGGGPMPPPRRGGRRRALVLGGSVVGLGVAGAAAFGAYWYLSSGPSPAEALPAGTLGYVALDMNPSGEQLLAARDTLERFPAWKDQDVSSAGDLREWVVEQIEKEADCGLDYGDDVEPWLGDSLAVAAVDLGEDAPTPVLVVQVTDADAADAGLQKLSGCGTSSEDQSGGWAVEGDWAVVAETEDLAGRVADEAAKGTLADDGDFQQWTEAAGDPGIVSMYAAPAAGGYLFDSMESNGAFDGLGAAFAEGSSAAPGSPAPQEFADRLKEFRGAAATVRFADGGLELELAADGSAATDVASNLTDRGGDVVETLPADTALAMGMGFEEGWLGDILDQLSGYAGDEMSMDDLLDEASSATGLDLPDDAETLMGRSAALVLGGDLDLDALSNAEDLSSVPVAVKVQGEPEKIQDVLGTITDQVGSGAEDVLGSDVDGDMVAVGPDADFREQVVADGGLGDTDAYRDVVPRSGEASVVLFANLDRFDSLLDSLSESGGDERIAENLSVLSAFGMSGWMEGEESHALVRIATDD